jgi:hypothetical protein
MQSTSSQTGFVAALFDPAGPLPEGVTTSRGRPDAERFNVYRNNVMVSLIGALEQKFPVTRRIVGDEFFREMARAYCRIAKPATPLIFQYGDSFPDFAAGFDAASTVPYLGDVARLEMFWTRAYHASDAVPIGAAEIVATEPGILAASSIVPHPSAALLRSTWPVGSIWEAHQHEEVAQLARSGKETVIVIRPDTEVRVHILPLQDSRFVEAMFSGASLAEAAMTASSDPEFDFGRALIGLASLGAIQSLKPSSQGEN